jgi:hypothetical protein
MLRRTNSRRNNRISSLSRHNKKPKSPKRSCDQSQSQSRSSSSSSSEDGNPPPPPPPTPSGCYKISVSVLVPAPPASCVPTNVTDTCLITQLDGNGNTSFGQTSCLNAPCFYIQCGGTAPQADVIRIALNNTATSPVYGITSTIQEDQYFSTDPFFVENAPITVTTSTSSPQSYNLSSFVNSNLVLRPFTSGRTIFNTYPCGDDIPIQFIDSATNAVTLVENTCSSRFVLPA